VLVLEGHRIELVALPGLAGHPEISARKRSYKTIVLHLPQTITFQKMKMPLKSCQMLQLNP
jgi:hypothetical protein